MKRNLVDPQTKPDANKKIKKEVFSCLLCTLNTSGWTTRPNLPSVRECNHPPSGTDIAQLRALNLIQALTHIAKDLALFQDKESLNNLVAYLMELIRSEADTQCVVRFSSLTVNLTVPRRLV